MNFSKKLLQKLSFLTALLIFSLLVAGCGDTPVNQPQTPTTSPEATSTEVLAIATPTMTVAETAGPVPTPTFEADPVRTQPPVVTVPYITIPPLVTGGSGKTEYYGPLPTPPRSLNPKAEAFTPDASKLLPKGNFIVGTANGLYLLNLAGDTEKLIAGGAAFSEPKVAPDGARVAAFRTDLVSRQSQLVLVEPAAAIKPLLPENGGVFLAAAWSPDSKTLALTRATDSNGDGLADYNDNLSLVLYDVASGKQQSVTEGGFAAWSPDGMRLALLIPGPSDNSLDPTTRKLKRAPNAVGIYNFANRGKRTLLEAKGMELVLGAAGFKPVPPDLKLGVRYFKAVGWHPDSKHITVSADVAGPSGLRAGVVLTATLDNNTPKVVTAGGDAAGQVQWDGDGQRLVFETFPQYPVGPNSATQIALLENASLQNAAAVKILLGNPATRSEAHSPAWISGGQVLAYLESEKSILTVVERNGQNPRRLFSGCNGFDWL